MESVCGPSHHLDLYKTPENGTEAVCLYISNPGGVLVLPNDECFFFFTKHLRATYSRD